MTDIHRAVSLDKVPEPLVPFIGDSVSAYYEAFGSKLHAVYAAGSSVHGEMNSASDLDFFSALDTAPKQCELQVLENSRLKMLDNQCSVPPKDVELKVMDLSRPNDKITIVRRTVVQVDGCLVYGKAIPGDIFAERSTPEIAGAFAQLFIDVKDALPVNDRLAAVRSHARHVTAKLALRNMEWTAVMRGATISSIMSRYVEDIEAFAPELGPKAKRSWELFRQALIDDDLQQEVDTLFNESLLALRDEGAVIEGPETGVS